MKLTLKSSDFWLMRKKINRLWISNRAEPLSSIMMDRCLDVLHRMWIECKSCDKDAVVIVDLELSEIQWKLKSYEVKTLL